MAEKSPSSDAKKREREARLAEQLRANLRRRKSQARNTEQSSDDDKDQD